MKKAYWLSLLYIAIIIAPSTFSVILNPQYRYGILYEVGKSFAFIGFMILVMQCILAARFKWISFPYGFDILIRFHKNIAIFAVILILLHPLLLAAGGAGWGLLFSLDVPWHIWVGKTALLVLFLQIGFSLFHMPDRLTFERWRFLHDIFAPLILVLIFFHGWYAGSDLQLASMRILWLSLAVIEVIVFSYHRFIRPHILSRTQYTVLSVEKAAADVWNIALAPPAGQETPVYFPGQFHFITFKRNRGLPEEEHHWTISSSPTDKWKITSTIKELGDFTATIGDTKPGDTAVVHGSFGRFSHVLHPQEADIVFIAGGIGITPIMSMLRYMRDTGQQIKALLLYANKTEDDIVFRKELHAIEQLDAPDLKVVHVIKNSSETWNGETGLIDRHMLARHIGSNARQKAFYICGPPGLRTSMVKALSEMDVSSKQIHLELFTFVE